MKREAEMREVEMGRNAEDGGIPRAYNGESGDHYSNEGFKGLCLGIIIRT